MMNMVQTQLMQTFSDNAGVCLKLDMLILPRLSI